MLLIRSLCEQKSPCYIYKVPPVTHDTLCSFSSVFILYVWYYICVSLRRLLEQLLNEFKSSMHLQLVCFQSSSNYEKKTWASRICDTHPMHILCNFTVCVTFIIILLLTVVQKIFTTSYYVQLICYTTQQHGIKACFSHIRLSFILKGELLLSILLVRKNLRIYYALFRRGRIAADLGCGFSDLQCAHFFCRKATYVHCRFRPLQHIG